VQYTSPFNMTRSPAASIPVGISSIGIPIGLQVVGNWLEDHLVLEMCNMLEEILPFTLRANI
jgi:aspartyl-tRNA(Asn)/glutamyl-tRNA(Gln) amidotransferase subunit A